MGTLSPRIKGAQNITPQHTHTDTHTYTRAHAHTHTHILKAKTSNTTTNLTTGYTLCNVKTEDTIKHNIALMTSTSRVYIPYPLGTIIK